MLQLLLAATLIVPCTVINTADVVTLNCKGYNEPLVISYRDWPKEWHGPELGFTYEIRVEFKGQDRFDGEFLKSKPDKHKLANEVRRARNEQLRWRRAPLQNPKPRRED